MGRQSRQRDLCKDSACAIESSVAVIYRAGLSIDVDGGSTPASCRTLGLSLGGFLHHMLLVQGVKSSIPAKRLEDQ